jgi:hypothetical protein
MVLLYVFFDEKGQGQKVLRFVGCAVFASIVESIDGRDRMVVLFVGATGATRRS